MPTLKSFGTLCGCSLAYFLFGCNGPAELTGYPVSTPVFHPENKMFYPATLPSDHRHTDQAVRLQHVFEVTPDSRTPVKPNEPLAVILQGVRIPEGTWLGTRDIAVVLDIQTGAQDGVESLVAFYQRDVPAGQMLNFSNLLVYAVPEWDGSTPPYFRLRVLDVRAERNRRTEGVLRSASRIAGEMSGLTPHPLIPIVAQAIEAAGLVLSNQQNQMLLDYQVQIYGSQQAEAAGQADLAILYTGPWLCVGRERDPIANRPMSADSWARDLYLDRKTGQLLDASVAAAPPAPGTVSLAPPKHRDMPYVSIVIMNEDVQVPKIVMDRSQSLIKLLASPDAKSDTDALEAAALGVSSAVKQYSAERNLVRFHSAQEIDGAIKLLKTPLGGLTPEVSEQQQRRLLRVINRFFPADKQFANAKDAVEWWDKNKNNGAIKLVEDPDDKTKKKFLWVKSNPTTNP